MIAYLSGDLIIATRSVRGGGGRGSGHYRPDERGEGGQDRPDESRGREDTEPHRQPHTLIKVRLGEENVDKLGDVFELGGGKHWLRARDILEEQLL